MFSDDGCGIPEDKQARIFEPFFTTKPVGQGTGQGLAIARAIVVDKHKGTMTFESKAGEGTTFRVRIPLRPRTERGRSRSPKSTVTVPRSIPLSDPSPPGRNQHGANPLRRRRATYPGRTPAQPAWTAQGVGHGVRRERQRRAFDLERQPADIVVGHAHAADGRRGAAHSRGQAMPPGAARIVLSGHMDESAAMRAAGVAHRYLTKPCPPETMEAMLTRTLELQALLRDQRIRSVLGGAVTLPPSPKLYQELNRLLASGKASLEAISP